MFKEYYTNIKEYCTNIKKCFIKQDGGLPKLVALRTLITYTYLGYFIHWHMVSIFPAMPMFVFFFMFFIFTDYVWKFDFRQQDMWGKVLYVLLSLECAVFTLYYVITIFNLMRGMY